MFAAIAVAVPDSLKRQTPDNDKCNANNCARQITGTRSGKMPPQTVRQSDCAAFQTATVVIDDDGDYPAYTVSGTLPAYATDCTTPAPAASAYASACSCWGYTAAVVTVYSDED
ncbi:hypothetical protein GQ53DRAFT_772754 [Thozetella sp. PMI_491]|nr:hypothetical protein GQ53DRAFT_772754 [Thozetella sp. PMI_491]